MPKYSELTQEVSVDFKIKFRKQAGSSTPSFPNSEIPCINEIMSDINRRLVRMGRVTHPIAREIAEKAKTSQEHSIVSQRSVMTGRLLNSIQTQSTHLSNNHAEYTISTGIQKQYPLTLIKGRRMVKPKNVRFLKFKPTRGAGYIFTKKAKRAKAKNYMVSANRNTHSFIPVTVEKYIRNLGF